jgi:SAM-dependent MidA family methyltransferase
VPEFYRALRIVLVETNPILRQRQRHALLCETMVHWQEDLENWPDGPMIVLANEFFDALPIHQYVARRGRWRERRVGLAGDDLQFVDGPLADLDWPPAGDGAIFETGEAACGIVRGLGLRLADQGGVGLLIDYGHPVSALGETLQAVYRHRQVSVFHKPGETDLTSHVDFQTLAGSAGPATVSPLVTQGQFLQSLGIRQRLEALAIAHPDQKQQLHTA